MIDIHSHILPNVDDGAKSFDETVKLLGMLKAQGIETVIATPHFDPSKSDAETRRQNIVSKYQEVRKALEGKGLPEIHLGYEVAYFDGISSIDNISDYLLAGTNKLLIELPFTDKITDRMVDEIAELTYSNKIVPIFAHLERYAKVKGVETVYEFIDTGDAFAQVSTDAIDSRRSWKAVCKLIEARRVYYVGSDAHSSDSRPPKFDEFLELAQKKYGRGFIAFLTDYSDSLTAEIQR